MSSKRNNHEADDRIRLARRQYTNVFSKVRALYIPSDKWIRLRTTHASSTTVTVEDHKYIVLKSYSTIVALYNISKRKLVEYGKYSRSTSRQVTWFYDELVMEYGKSERINLGLESVRE